MSCNAQDCTETVSTPNVKIVPKLRNLALKKVKYPEFLGSSGQERRFQSLQSRPFTRK